MSRTSILRAALPVTLIACSAAGTTPQRMASPPREPAVELVTDGARLRVRVRDALGNRRDVAELAGAWLDTGDGGQWLPTGAWHADQVGVSTDLAGPADHDVRLTVRVLPDGDVAVEIEDRIAIRTALAGLGVGWRLCADRPPDEISVPLLHPGDENVAGDIAFRSPIAFVRAGSIALAVEPDLDALRNARRLPTSLAIERSEHGALVIHAADAQHVVATLHEATATHDPSRAVRVRDETIRVAHRLFVSADAAASRTLAARIGRIWRTQFAVELGRSAAPFGEETWADTTDDALRWRLARDLRTVELGERDALALVDADGSDIARFGARRNGLNDAVALARRAARTGVASDRETAARLAQFALSAPRRGGLTPHGVRLGDRTKSDEWLTGDPDGPRPDAYCAADAATTACLELELAELLPELRPPVLEAARSLARFLRSSQRPDGAIPGVYESVYLTPVALDEDELPGATAAPALFLTLFAEFADDPDSRAAARRALRYVASKVRERDAPLADPSLRRSVWRDPRSGDTVRDLAPLAAIARAAALTALRDAQYTSMTGDLLGALAELQQAWTPPWFDGRGEAGGGFGGSNADASWSADAQPLAAQAMLDGYAATGARDWLERASAAMRAGLVPSDSQRRSATPTADELALATGTCAVVERCRTMFGQAVVDVSGRFAIGLDAVWFDVVELDRERIALRAMTHAADLGVIDVRIVGDGANATIEANQTAITRSAADRFEVRPVREPSLSFRPPPMLDAADPWRPVARFRGPTPAPGSLHVEVFREGRLLARIPMQATDDGEIAAVSESGLSLAGLVEGDRIDARLDFESGGRRVTRPPAGFRSIAVGGMTCIDPGDDLEDTLVDASPRARIERFVDGRENARALPRGASFAHALPISRDAAAVTVRLRAAGALKITDVPSGRTLYVDSGTVADGDRAVEFRIADPRLWPDGRLVLRFSPLAERASVARIEFRATGLAARSTAVGTSRSSTTPDVRLAALVLPLAIGPSPSPVPELLRQAFVGEIGYRNTPEPASRSTAGSLVRWISRLSGGRTTFTADLRPTATPELTGLDPRSAEFWSRIVDGAARELESVRDVPDVIVLVVTDPGLLPPNDLNLGAIPVVVLSEREPDGSYLAVGTIARTILSRLYALEPLDETAQGAFGDLALTGSTNRHMPAIPAGLNLVRTGWADLVDVGSSERPIRLPALIEGRTMLRAASPAVLGAPELLIETRQDNELDSEPDHAGLLVYRRFGAGHEPILRLLDSRTARPAIWRLSPRTGALETPFVPGTRADLFRDTFRLDDLAPPSLATPFGETPWTIDRVDIVGGNAAELQLRDTTLDYLADVGHGWLAGDARGIGPIAEDGADSGHGAVRRIGDAFDIAIAARDGGLVRGVFEDRGARTGRRLFGRLVALDGGRCELRIRSGERLLARFSCDGSDTPFVVDLPPDLRSTTLAVELERLDGSPRARLDRLVAVPRSKRAIELPMPRAETVDVQTSDGVFRAGLHAFELDERGFANLRVPIVCPDSRGVLRISAAVAAGDARPAELRVSLRSIEGRTPLAIHDGLPIGGRPGEPVRIALCELPGESRRDLAFLDLELRGMPRQTIYIVAFEVDRL